MEIKELIKKAHDNAGSKGFYHEKEYSCAGFEKCDHKIFTCNENKNCGEYIPIVSVRKIDKNIGELLMLIVSELGEALEADRKGTYPLYELFQSEIDEGKPFQEAFKNHIEDTLHDELADAVIRICDMCGYLNIDLEKHIELKMKYNEIREHKHREKY